MAQTNRERIGIALDLLNKGLAPFIEREMRAVYGDKWLEEAESNLRDARISLRTAEGTARWDTQVILIVMWEEWNAVFRNKLGHTERSMVSELRDVRNKWAHQEQFSSDDTYRALDSAERLLRSVSAKEAQDVDPIRQEILRIRFEEQTRYERRKAAAIPIEGQPIGGRKPWREVVTPHPDVASGHYQQAEFAADLAQVHRNEGASEYRDPKEFYQRTFLTEGLRRLLKDALVRLSGKDGNPVIQLQTNFGGGKTHSLLALYHLFSGAVPGDLPGIDEVMLEAEVETLPPCRRAVLVGTALSPAQPSRKPDGTMPNTLWGELAWQLGKAEGYALVEQADRQGVSPGTDVLQDVFERYGPCLVMIDEWIAYVRQLYGVDGLPAGSFDAHFTFAQSLTEAARRVPNALVIASIPTSDIEIGGERGREALTRLENVFGRVETSWRPASAEEGFEIVRRRLFQPIDSPEKFRERDAVVDAFSRFYRDQAQEFPSAAREGEYERRMQAAYPIHPELFDRLYKDWSSLDRFQRTRGVLRLMAAVIHTLWERNDSSLLILPANIPIDNPVVQSELTRYLENPSTWDPVIEDEVDGPKSLPLSLDSENPNLGRYSACRRVARTVFMGSAPTAGTSHPGLDDRSVKLGCVQPGESVATFGDALRRLSDHDRVSHLYVDGQRYWFSTQPSINSLARDRANQQNIHDVWEELKTRLKSNEQTRGDFCAVHCTPDSTGDVPDEMETRLVILGPEHQHTRQSTDSSAMNQAKAILEQRGSSPRHFKNMLVFLAPDKSRLDDLEQAVRQYMAWESILTERETLNLDVAQTKQATTKNNQANDIVNTRIQETYTWLLVPTQPDPQGPVEWQPIRCQGSDALAVQASRKLKPEEHLVTQFSGTRLHMELEKCRWEEADHINIKDLWEYCARYLYLTRLRDSNVLLEAVRDGVAKMTWSEDFAYAERWDEDRKRYLGLVAGQQPGSIVMDGHSVLVKPEIAQRQLDEDAKDKPPAGDKPRADTPTGQEGTPEDVTIGEEEPPKARRFHGSVSLDPIRVGRDAGRIAQEVIQHLTTQPGAKVEVTLEIQAIIPEGAPDNVIRTVTENCQTLKFTSHGFENE
ncbi:MAG: Swt1 family HEPN domain-containing protein [bacterium]